MSQRSARALTLGLVGLVALAALGVGGGFAAATYRMVLNYNEGWNAYHALAATSGGSLYPPAAGLFVNNYAPLSFYVVGAVGVALGDMVMAGRVVSSLALLAVAWGIAAAARRLSPGGAIVGAYSAAAFLATVGTYFAGYVGMNDSQMLAHAPMTAALVLLLSGAMSWGRAAAVVVLMLAAGLTKQMLVALPAATLLYLLVFDRSGARRFLAVGAAACAAALGAVALFLGQSFFDSLLAPRITSWARAASRSREWLPGLAWMAAFVAPGVPPATRDRRSVWLLAAYAGSSALLGFFFVSGAGVWYNAYFDLLIALSVLCGPAAYALAARVAPRPGGRWLALAVPCLLPLTFFPAARLRAVEVRDGWLRGEWAAAERATAEDVAVLGAERGAVMCQLLALCYWADKPPAVDLFNASQAVLTGRLPADSLLAPFCGGRFALVQLQARTPARAREPFADRLAAEMDRSYALVRSSPNGSIYGLRRAPCRTAGGPAAGVTTPCASSCAGSPSG